MQLTKEDRAGFGIGSPPNTGVETRLEALIAQQQQILAALQAMQPAPAGQPAPTNDSAPVRLQEPAPTGAADPAPAAPAPRKRGRPAHAAK